MRKLIIILGVCALAIGARAQYGSGSGSYGTIGLGGGGASVLTNFTIGTLFTNTYSGPVSIVGASGFAVLAGVNGNVNFEAAFPGIGTNSIVNINTTTLTPAFNEIVALPTVVVPTNSIFAFQVVAQGSGNSGMVTNAINNTNWVYVIAGGGGSGSSGGGGTNSAYTYTNQFWVDAYNGSDANNGESANTAFLTLSNAFTFVTNSSNYKIVHVNAGVYNLAKTLLDVVNCKLVGAGNVAPKFLGATTNNPAVEFAAPTSGTVITLDANSAVNIGDNADIQNLTIYQTISGHYPLDTIGSSDTANGGDPNYPSYQSATSTNFFIQNVTLYGFFIHAAVLASTNVISGTIDHCDFLTQRNSDCLSLGVIPNGSSTTNWYASCPNNFLLVKDSLLMSAANAISASHTNCGVVALMGSGIVNLQHNEILQVFSGGTNTPGISISGTNLLVTCAGNTFQNYFVPSFAPTFPYASILIGFNGESVAGVQLVLIGYPSSPNQFLNFVGSGANITYFP